MDTVNKTFILAILFSFLCIADGYAKADDNFYFKHYDSNSGLSQNTVNCLLQDRTGFIWLGTKDGLNRFDGYSFKHIGNDERNYCSIVSSLMEDSSGIIWVGTHQGVCVYNPETERLDLLDKITDDGHSITRQVTDFCADGDSSIYISVDNEGIFKYDKNSQTLSLVLDQQKKGIGSINKIEYTPDGIIWIGTFGGGLFYSDDKLKSVNKYFTAEGTDYFRGAIINSIKIKGGKVFVATGNIGLHYIDVVTGEVSPVFTIDETGEIPFIRDFLFYDKSHIWLGTESGLYIYNISEKALLKHLKHNYFDHFSISDNAIYSLLSDRRGGVWIGSYFGGADYLDMNKMRFDKYYRNNSSTCLDAERVRQMCCDKNGIIYIGSEDNGVSVLNPKTGVFAPLECGLPGANIQSLCIDGNDLWIGTFSSGLTIKNLVSGQTRNITSNDHSGLNSDYVFSICRTIGGDMYISTYSGLQRYDRNSKTFKSDPELTDIFVYNIFEDSSGNLWVSTYDKGVYMRKGGSDKWIKYKSDNSQPNSIPSNNVYDILEDTNHNIWIMTQNGPCVYRPSDETFDRSFLGINKIQGVVYRMVNDSYGRYWLTSNHGLYCIDTHRDMWHHFTVADGLPTNQFNYNSSITTDDGRIYLGTIDGLVSFDPMLFTSSHTESMPVLSELTVNGMPVEPGDGSPIAKSISFASSINLSYNGDSFAIKVVSLDFSLLSDQQVKYRLDGVDNEWRFIPLGECISYSNLDSGSYRLEYAISDSAGENISPVREINIIVDTPFYKTTTAITLFILIFLLLIWLAFRHYQRYSRLNNQRYLEKYTREKERESYDSKIKFFTNVAHEIRTPLSLIKAPLDCIFRSKALDNDPEIRENLDVINMNVDRLLLLANQLLDFRKMENGKFQIHKRQCDIKALLDKIIIRFSPTITSAGKVIKVDMPENEVTANVDPEAITKIISNLFTNAIKYGEHYIHVCLKCENDNFIVTLVNDGEVIDSEKREYIFSLFTRLESHSEKSGTGIGLAYARSLAQMHGGTLAIVDSDKENIFVLSIPLNTTEEIEEKGKDLDSIIRRTEKNVTVLLVEDNPEMLSFLEKKFIASNYNVKKASNGQEALDILGYDYVDIVVSDVMMPVMDGYELLTRIKGDINISHIPVVLLTAKTRMEDKLSGIDAGADAYIEKPFALEYLLATISTILRNRDRMRRRLESLPLAKVSEKGLSKVDEEFLRKINELIHNNFDNPDFSMEDIIESLGMSRTTFYRKIKGMLDLNPNEYIKMERLKRAAQLFSEGHTGVSEVSYMVGFSSPGYFTKCFQKQFGMSPKEYIASADRKTSD